MDTVSLGCPQGLALVVDTLKTLSHDEIHYLGTWYKHSPSCNRCVIPDVFYTSHRSPGSGLYDNLQQYDLPYAEAIFEIDYFHHNPRPFFALAKELYPGNYQPNLTHYFVRLLHDKGQLLRMYTQNIDGLERCKWMFCLHYRF